MKALVTGSGGLIGSECVRLLSSEGWDVVGIDNDMRQTFFGPMGSTAANAAHLIATCPGYRHLNIDIRDRQAIRDLVRSRTAGLHHPHGCAAFARQGCLHSL